MLIAFRKSNKGQSLVELALGVTVLVWLLSGIFDLGRAIFWKFALQDAAEEGVIYGVVYPNQCTLIERRVENSLEGNSDIPANPYISVKINDLDCNSDELSLAYGQLMEIEVSSTYTMSMPFLTGTEVSLKGTANGTILRPPPGS